MSRLFSYCLLVFLLGTTLVYAGNGTGCPFTKTFNTCSMTGNSVCKSKTTKQQAVQKLKSTTKPAQPSEHKPSSADTFEKFIAPFIETVAPHFYDKIIRKEEKKAPVGTSTCRAWS